MKRTTLFVILVSFLLVAAGAAAAKNVGFYEKKASKNYKTDSGLSVFKAALEAEGYVVSKIEFDLTPGSLDSQNLDVLVIPELSSDLSANELAAIFEFVMQDGKGLFIMGSGCSKTSCYANQITIPFGMSIDEGGFLENEDQPVSGSAKPVNTNFVVGSFSDNEGKTRLAVQGVNKIAVFGASGIVISGDAMYVARGDDNTYSPKSEAFPKSSRPPVASAALVGKGLVFILSDADVLMNTYLDTSKYKYDNKRFGVSIVKWLATPRTSVEELNLQEVEIVIRQLDSDIEDLNNEIGGLEADVASRDATIAGLNMDLTMANEELEAFRSESLFGIKYLYWAIGILGFGLLLLAAVVAGGKKKDSGRKESKGADEIGGFGYEFDSGGGEPAFGANAEGFEELMGMPDKSKGGKT